MHPPASRVKPWLPGKADRRETALLVLSVVQRQGAVITGGRIPRTDGDVLRVIRLAAADTQPDHASSEQQKESDNEGVHVRKRGTDGPD